MGIYCEIHVESPTQGYFLPGANVTGLIKYTFTKPKDITNIVLSLKGKGYCKFANKNYRPNHNNDNMHRHEPSHLVGNDVYVNLRTSLKSNGTVDAGVYTAPINFVLLYNIPPSYSYENMRYKASIFYYVSIKFSVPGMLSFAKRFKKDIFVGNLLTPTMPPGPATYEISKTLSNFFRKKDNLINLKATLDKSLVHPGDKLELNFEIENKTNLDLPKIKTDVLRTKTFRSDCGRMDVYEKVLTNCKAETSSIPKGTDASFTSVVHIPLDDYTIINSRIISREYRVIITVKVPGLHRDAKLNIPILIGEVMTQPVYQAPPPVYISPPVDAPPSYWEAMEEVNKGDELYGGSKS